MFEMACGCGFLKIEHRVNGMFLSRRGLRKNKQFLAMCCAHCQVTVSSSSTRLNTVGHFPMHCCCNDV